MTLRKPWTMWFNGGPQDGLEYQSEEAGSIAHAAGHEDEGHYQLMGYDGDGDDLILTYNWIPKI